MAVDPANQKSEVATREEAILEFWKKEKIFEKSLTQPSTKGEFIFYDGPPFATGLPHYGHILASTIKDVVPRYQTMRGFHVARRWGWDTHGLPIETLVEKKLNIKEKKEIEALGIDTFNETARSLVLEYVGEWKKTVERIGRWVDFDGSYKTMDNTYIESVWWTIAELARREYVYEGLRVLPYCTRCETPLAKAEIAMDNSYKEITEEAVTVKFKIKGFPNAYFLAWTTTPWTLPGNVALAVGGDIVYVEIKVGEEILVIAKERLSIIDQPYEIVAEHTGKEMAGMEYEPLYKVTAVGDSGKKAHYVATADFVTTEDGTGIVHTAVIYGEDDFTLGKKIDLPMIQLLDSRGHFNDKAPELVRGEYLKKAGKMVTKDLEERGLLFAKSPNTHSYPHCYRCGTALIYNAIPSWFINIQKIKSRLIEKNEDIHWVPDHLKHGRFLHIVENAPDWNISRNRFWASPLPIWKCAQCAKVHFIESLEALSRRAKPPRNTYWVMRHGQTISNGSGAISYATESEDGLTDLGREQVEKSAEALGGAGVTKIVASPFRRAKETAEIVARVLGIPEESVRVDTRLAEINLGEFSGKTWGEYHEKYPKTPENFSLALPQGESYHEVQKRMMDVVLDAEKTYEGEKIVIITHGGPASLLLAGASGANWFDAVSGVRDGHSHFNFSNAQVQSLDWKAAPRNRRGEIDLHRPYIDEIELSCDCGASLTRIPEVVDCWVESAAMPFAAEHYPFEKKEEFGENFPGHFVAEYIAQTRTWFYYSHVINTILFDQAPFRHVVTTGNVQNEKGEKMSKSKQNYPDPWLLMDRFGVDALRYYLLSSQVMRAEDMNFSEKGVDEVYKKLILRLGNVLSFYEMYAGDLTSSSPGAPSSKNILDEWILVRLADLAREVTRGMEAYELDRATWPFMEFVDDLSTWYLRRSRDRVKEGGVRGDAFVTLRYVLFELARLLAPFTPYSAEQIYRAVGGAKESVHLEGWPEEGTFGATAVGLLEKMQMTRNIVSQALELRAKANIKVRQPLATLKIQKEKVKISEEYIELIKDEVNVKDVVFDDTFELDTVLTPELEREGRYRDLVREVQDLRKEANLKPGELVTVTVSESCRETLEFFPHFAQVVGAREVRFGEKASVER